MLYVRPRKARNLIKKSFFKGGFMHSTATVCVSIAGQSKKTAQVDGSNPTFSDVLEFILGEAPFPISCDVLHSARNSLQGLRYYFCIPF